MMVSTSRVNYLSPRGSSCCLAVSQGGVVVNAEKVELGPFLSTLRSIDPPTSVDAQPSEFRQRESLTTMMTDCHPTCCFRQQGDPRPWHSLGRRPGVSELRCVIHSRGCLGEI